MSYDEVVLTSARKLTSAYSQLSLQHGTELELTNERTKRERESNPVIRSGIPKYPDCTISL